MFWSKKPAPKATVPPLEPPKPEPTTEEIKEITFRIYLDWDDRPYWDIVANNYVESGEYLLFYTINGYTWQMGSYSCSWYKAANKHEPVVSIRASDVRAIEVLRAETVEVPCT